MKVQIFIPPQGYVAQRWSEGNAMPPLGILFLGGALQKAGIEVDIVPADLLAFKKEDIRRRIQDYSPDLLGVTTCSENRFDSFSLLRIAKKVNPRIKTVLGGPHITMSGNDTFAHVKEVDILVFGEAEVTIVELCRALESRGELSKVRGISFRHQDNRIITTPARSRMTDLDSLPFPARHLIPEEKYRFFVTTRDQKRRKAFNIITSRGCPFNCYFCSTPINWGRKTIGFSTDRVIAEIQDAVENHGAEYIWFYDDTFNYNKARTHSIMDKMIERGFNIKFTSEFRIDLVDEPLLEKMRKAGLEIGSFGIESGNARIRREIVKKDFDIELAYRFLRWSKKFDFIPGPFFVFSHYQETWQNAQETIEVLQKAKEINPEADIATSILHVYPGTPLEKIARQIKILPKNFSWSNRKSMRKVYKLPAAQGDVPLFKHKLSWRHIAELVMKWSTAQKKNPVTPAKVLKTLKSIRSWKDIRINTAFFLTMLKFKLRKIFKFSPRK